MWGEKITRASSVVPVRQVAVAEPDLAPHQLLERFSAASGCPDRQPRSRSSPMKALAVLWLKTSNTDGRLWKSCRRK